MVATPISREEVQALDGPTVPARWTRHRLIARATNAVVRWLADEVRRLSPDDVPAEFMRQGTTMQHARCGNSWPILRPGRLPDRAIVMLYWQKVLGESLEGLAAEAGISLDAIRKRRERAIRAIRARLAA